MARLIVLGSAAAVSDATHDNTHLLLQGDHGTNLLIDCGSNPLVKLQRLGVGADDLTGVVLTHFHPDHVAGLTIMLMQLWLQGRSRPLPIYGLHHCLERARIVLDASAWETWPEFFGVQFCPLAERDDVFLLEDDEFRITSWPTEHYIPTIGLRIEVKSSGRVVGYTCDTALIPSLARLAADADLLIHEAAGAGPGHSSAEQAGETATAARARRLVLIHYDPRRPPQELIDEACATFSGPVQVAQDGEEYPL